MKTLLIVFGLLISLLILNTEAWSMPIVDTHNKALLRDIRNITRQCVHTERNLADQSATSFSSTCAILTIDSSTTAHVFAQGEWLTAQIVPSPDADGDDLAQLLITNDKGQLVAERKNVLAYGHIVFAMAGGEIQ